MDGSGLLKSGSDPSGSETLQKLVRYRYFHCVIHFSLYKTWVQEEASQVWLLLQIIPGWATTTAKMRNRMMQFLDDWLPLLGKESTGRGGGGHYGNNYR